MTFETGDTPCWHVLEKTYSNEYFSVHKHYQPFGAKPYYLIRETDYVIVSLARDSSFLFIYENKATYASPVPGLISGSIQSGELPEHAAQREILEEASIQIDCSMLIPIGEYIISPNRYFAKVYLFFAAIPASLDSLPNCYHHNNHLLELMPKPEYYSWYASRQLAPPVVSSFLLELASSYNPSSTI